VALTVLNLHLHHELQSPVSEYLLCKRKTK
jgi:hypothetical protein